MQGTTWILVADAARARVLVWRPALGTLDEVETFAHAEGRLAARELVTDGPGRHWGGAGAVRSALDPHTEPRQAEEDRFARELAGTLEEAAGDRYEQLVIVAPPAFLGRLRANLGRNAAARLVETLAKDYSRLSPARLPELLGARFEWLAPTPPPRRLPT